MTLNTIFNKTRLYFCMVHIMKLSKRVITLMLIHIFTDQIAQHVIQNTTVLKVFQFHGCIKAQLANNLKEYLTFV